MHLLLPSSLRSWSQFYLELAQLTRAGFNAIDAFKKAGLSNPSTEVKIIAALISTNLKLGKSIEQVMHRVSDQMPALDRALIISGFRSGRTEQSFDKLSIHYEQLAHFRGKLIQQLSYPVILAHLAIFTFPSSAYEIAMKFGLFAFLKLKLWPLFLLWVSLIGPFFLLAQKQDSQLRRLFEDLTDHLPVYGKAKKLASLSRFCLSLEGLSAAGFTPKESWPLAADASGDQEIQDCVKQILPRLNSGKSLSDSLPTPGPFPAEFVGQLNTAEISGQLQDTFKRLANYYAELANSKMQIVSEWLPRIIYMIVMISVAYNMIQGTLNSLEQINKIIQ